MSLETQTKVGETWLDQEGIIHTSWKPHSILEVTDARESIRVIASHGGDRRRPALADITNVVSMSREVRRYYAGPETASVESAVALLVRSPLSKAIGNFFLGLNKPLIPTRLFNDEAEAMQWLRTFLE